MSKQFFMTKENELRIHASLTKLLQGWIWISRMGFSAVSVYCDLTRSNVHKHVHGHEDSKLSIRALARTAALSGVKVALDGTISLFSGISQQWKWNAKSFEFKDKIAAYLLELHNLIKSPKKFTFTKVSIGESAWFSIKNVSFAIIEFTDEYETVSRAILEFDSDQSDFLTGFFREIEVFDVTSEVQLSTEQAIQMVNGISASEILDPMEKINWNDWIPLCADLAKRGYRSEDVIKGTKLPAIRPTGE